MPAPATVLEGNPVPTQPETMVTGGVSLISHACSTHMRIPRQSSPVIAWFCGNDDTLITVLKLKLLKIARNSGFPEMEIKTGIQ